MINTKTKTMNQEEIEKEPNLEELLNKEGEKYFEKKVSTFKSRNLLERYIKSLKKVFISLIISAATFIFGFPLLSVFFIILALVNLLIIVPIDHTVSKKGSVVKYLKMKEELSYPIIYFIITVVLARIFKQLIVSMMTTFEISEELVINTILLIPAIFVIWIIRIIITTYLKKN